MSKPKEFVSKHPRAVMFAMWAIKVGIKYGAAQLCVTVPTETLNDLSGVTDGLLTEVLTTSLTYVQGMAVDEEGEHASM